jgi:ornithine carbamoyltransferase
LKPQHSTRLSVKQRRYARALVEAACDLERTHTAGEPPQALRGRNIALLGEGVDQPECDTFVRAATRLGARVAHIRFTQPGTRQDESVEKMAHVLGRLYDAIVCLGCDPRYITWLERQSGIPVCGRFEPDANGVAKPDRGAADRLYLLLAQLLEKLA